MAVKSLAANKANLDSLHTGADLKIALFSGALSEFVCGFSTGSAVITATGHNFLTGMRVRFVDPPSSLLTTQDYWIVAAPANQIQVSATRGGSPIVHNGTGGANPAVLEQPPFATYGSEQALVHDLAVMERHEVNYQGSARQSLTYSSAVINYSTGVVATPTLSVEFLPTTGAVVFRYVGLIRDDAVLEALEDLGSDETITTAGGRVNWEFQIP